MVSLHLSQQEDAAYLYEAKPEAQFDFQVIAHHLYNEADNIDVHQTTPEDSLSTTERGFPTPEVQLDFVVVAH